MKFSSRAFNRFVASLLALVVMGCVPTLDLKDFKDLPSQQPIHRYAIAHRGSLHQGLPDNSLPALQDSLSKGVQFLEVDVRKAKDGELFLFHDGSLKDSNFTSPKDLKGKKVQELTSDERGRVRLDPHSPICIPTLKDALRVVRSSPSAALQLDLKGESDELLDATVALLKQEHALERAIIQLKNPIRIRKIRSQEPTARILARVRDMGELRQAIASGVEFIELERWITGNAIEEAHAADIPVVLNVAAPQYDTEVTWNFFRSKGVDSIMTDHAVKAR